MLILTPPRMIMQEKMVSKNKIVFLQDLQLDSVNRIIFWSDITLAV
jgi:hypothetical protein